MKMENDPGLERMYEILRQYDDGVIRTVAARKAMEIAELRLTIGNGEPTRNQSFLLKYLDEDRIVYETVAYVLSIRRDRFESEIAEIAPAMNTDFTMVPRAVMDAYRRGLSDLDLRMEDRAAGYVDDIIGIVNGGCEY